MPKLTSEKGGDDRNQGWILTAPPLEVGSRFFFFPLTDWRLVDLTYVLNTVHRETLLCSILLILLYEEKIPEKFLGVDLKSC